MAQARVLVCGGRDFADRDLLMATLDAICLERGWVDRGNDDNWLPSVRIISGKARGADTLAIDWAVVNWCTWTEFPADWNKHGKSAGHIRNQQMPDEGKPDLVVAFPGGAGTRNMIARARKAGVEVVEVSHAAG